MLQVWRLDYARGRRLAERTQPGCGQCRKRRRRSAGPYRQRGDGPASTWRRRDCRRHVLHGRAAPQRAYANPIDIDYRYNFEQQNQGISYRSGADPVIVVQRGKYYLFETIGDGYWESEDLGTWRHITPTRWPLLDVVAPAVLSVRDTIYLLPSATSPVPILMFTDAASGRVEFY